jgi:hypothetical protein
MSRRSGRTTVEHLIAADRLERLDPGGAVETAEAILERASARVSTATAALRGGDVSGAFVNAYDAYRMSAESLLARQALRSAGGDGSHVTVEDAVSAQFSYQVAAFAKPTFERLRRTRHAAQYFDPSAPEITPADARWAIDTATDAIDGSRRISRRLGPFG